MLSQATVKRMFVRPQDGVLVMPTSKGDRWLNVNETAAFLLQGLKQGKSHDDIVNMTAEKWNKDPERVGFDFKDLIQRLEAFIDDPRHPEKLGFELVNANWELERPKTLELTTHGACNDKCVFCYMSATSTTKDAILSQRTLTYFEWVRIIDRGVDEIGVRELIVTGGEPTIYKCPETKKDVTDIIRYAKSRGLIVHMITNGMKLGANARFRQELKDSGVDTVQVSLECPDEGIHNRLVGNAHAWKWTLNAVVQLRKMGVNAYPNSTITKWNRESVVEMPAFLKKLGITTWSANAVVRAGRAVNNLDDVGLTYTEIAGLARHCIENANLEGIKFTFFLPVPNCILPPGTVNGNRGCTAANTVAVVNSQGHLVVCNNTPKETIGDMLNTNWSFDDMWQSDAAKYWRERQFAPEVCKDCQHYTTCRGACPLYWENGGDLKEIYRARGKPMPVGYNETWRAQHAARPRIDIPLTEVL